jgi:hypothetical protein
MRISAGALIVLSTLCAQSVFAQQPPVRIQDSQIGEVILDRSTKLNWQPATNYFNSPGPVRITITDAVTGEKTILTADDAEGSPTGDIIVKGRLTLERPEGTLAGKALLYRAVTKTGEVMDASATVANLRVTGNKIEILPGDKLKASGASLTTCKLDVPDYRITAKELLIDSNGTVRAKDMTFWIKGTRIISLPSLKKNFRRQVNDPLPLPVYNKQNLINFTYRGTPVEAPGTSFAYDLLFTFKRTPQGFISYEHELGHVAPNAPPPQSRLLATTEPLRSPIESSTAVLRGVADVAIDRSSSNRFFATLNSNTFVYNRKRIDLQVSRLPEVGFALGNLFGRKRGGQTVEDETDATMKRRSRFGDLFNPELWLVNGEIGVGYFQERPTNVNSSRLGVRMDGVSPIAPLNDRLWLRLAATVQPSYYGNGGSSYALFAPEAELTWMLKPNTRFSTTYRYQKAFGTTPFAFDRLDVAKELRFRYAFLGANWAYDLGVIYDMDRLRAYDTVAGIRRRFDCFEFGIAYQQRNQGIGFILNLFPGDIGKARTKATK